MPDFDVKTRVEIDWEKYGTLPAGTRIRVMLDALTILDKTIPVGKKLVGRISIDGILEDA